MLLPRTYMLALRATVSNSPISNVLEALRSAPSQTLQNLARVRYAHHQSEGRANGVKDGPGKRLGAKKTAGQYVIPGHIIFRQRGTKWFPGENCDMGRDHTIFAARAGYVQFYRDPLKHPKRQYIGVTFDRDDKLPYPPNAPRRRRLGMVATDSPSGPPAESIAASAAAEADMSGGNALVAAAAAQAHNSRGRDLMATGTVAREVPRRLGRKGGRSVSYLDRGEDGMPLAPNARTRGMYREANWEIGRAAEREGIKVKKWVPGDRWSAWRQRAKRRERAQQMSAMRSGGKKKGKGKKGRGKK
ncbi:ribosomal L27 protein-domain-containing protein [Lineolata rhizophorae]|uniref:Large ribosomal subunit protein bL27m n=1 Tax=Lineolata rhizophorae TaxID=578093 RepID=A0A6A6NUZ3_9PEZI|nr:ribosomal L27 protein-domain-containing protein [Lineolata rhizophorae]